MSALKDNLVYSYSLKLYGHFSNDGNNGNIWRYVKTVYVYCLFALRIVLLISHMLTCLYIRSVFSIIWFSPLGLSLIFISNLSILINLILIARRRNLVSEL